MVGCGSLEDDPLRSEKARLHGKSVEFVEELPLLGNDHPGVPPGLESPICECPLKSHRCLEVFLVIPEARFPGFAASANPIPIGLACPKHARYPTNCGPCQDP